MIKRNSKIYIAGHSGLVGSSLLKLFKDKDFSNLIYERSRNLDLRDSKKVNIFFKKKKIEYMIIAAAKVGGIMSNSTYPTEFFQDNSLIQINLLSAALKYGVKRSIFIGSSCIYPREAKTPIKEEYLLTGRMEETNKAMAISKISGLVFCEAMFKQYGLDTIAVMPTNVYGEKDNFDKFNGHVVPSMISKFLTAKREKIELLGTGKPLRELIHSDDLAEAIYFLLNTNKKKISKICKNKYPMFNIGTGENVSIKYLANLIKKIIKYNGKIIFNSKFPDGTMKKNLDCTRIRKLGWKPRIKLIKGLKRVIQSRTYNGSFD